ncbi:TPA: hypothetical protein DCW54_00360 [Candidatus Dependentiae bacterium]|nr:hypothetical protein [Candidatus Dependentiae bacterium]
MTIFALRTNLFISLALLSLSLGAGSFFFEESPYCITNKPDAYFKSFLKRAPEAHFRIDSRYFPSKSTKSDYFSTKEIHYLNSLLGTGLLATLNAPPIPKPPIIQSVFHSASNEEVLATLRLSQQLNFPAHETAWRETENELYRRIGALLRAGCESDTKQFIEKSANDYQPFPIYTVKESAEETTDIFDTSDDVTEENKTRIAGFLSKFTTSRPNDQIVAFTKNMDKEEIFVAYEDGSIVRYYGNYQTEILATVTKKILLLFLDKEKQMLFCLNNKGLLHSWHLSTNKEAPVVNFKQSFKTAQVNLARTKIQILNSEEQTNTWEINKLSPQEIYFLKGYRSACCKKKQKIKIPESSILLSWFSNVKELLSGNKQNRLIVTKKAPSSTKLAKLPTQTILNIKQAKSLTL